MEQARQLFLAALEFLEAERFAEAEARLLDALALAPGRPSILLNLAAALMAQQRHAEALIHCVNVCEIAPENATAWMNRGLCELAIDDEAAALRSLLQARELEPANPEAHANLAVVLSQLGDDTGALSACETALSLAPGDAEQHTSHGALLRALNRLDDARQAHLRALQLNPQCVNAHWNLSLVELTLGNYAAGFAGAEWRWRDKSFATRHPMPASPRWDGKLSLNGKRILVIGEQGLGDTIQFCRHVHDLKRLGASVVLQVQPTLHGLMQCLREWADVISLSDTPPSHDVHCPLMSLPGLLEVRPDSIPAPIPYLFAAPDRHTRWSQRLGPAMHPRIGLVWQGNQALRAGRNRSLPVALLDQLLRDDLEFIVLQKDLGEEDRRWLSQHRQVRQFADLIEDFADTAALISLCDRVISIDTSVAHLACAMGKPSSLMLIHSPDWRWGRASVEGDRPAWYPDARLFRQTHSNDWASVISSIVATLP